jgi:SAM-dependent methyltransferase
MRVYYFGVPYPKYMQTIRWSEVGDIVFDEMCKLIPPYSYVLEVGCGSGRRIPYIRSRTESIVYFGCDLSLQRWRTVPHGPGDYLTIASADTLPFPSTTMHVVMSIFVIEHLVFPARFLDEAWRILRSQGRLLLVAPDFQTAPMASDRIGLSYGSGRDKIRQGRFLDAALTLYDTRIRIPKLRSIRNRQVQQGRSTFPILTNPRCLSLKGFVPDCDAVYPSSADEIVTYLSSKADFDEYEIFYQDQHKFGLMIKKR